ncbi:anoctamin-7-like, partial [Protobothrops mucrosquamatus]|uniref:anoctamin-7-like n=1 Tax=Protobothrops mucrosquamatus TaxID=103944 RepID=UPI0010FB54B0
GEKGPGALPDLLLFFAGFYTAWLIPAAAIGSFVFLAGLFVLDTNVPAKEVCKSGGDFLMCPLCDTCGNWNLSEICPMAKLGYLFDHPGTVFFSIFMSFWAVTFLEYWKRRNATLAHHWDCMDFQEEEERPRPEFAAMAPCLEQNPITGLKEPYFPKHDRLSRILTGSMAIVIMLCVVMIFLVSVIMYRGIVSTAMYHTGNRVLMTQAGNIANISSSMVNLVLILLMSQVYTSLAEKLTRWEMHRTQTQHEDAFTFKVFIFQFVNFYSSPFYVAFFKGSRFVGYPGRYGQLLGMRNEDCGPGGCLIELAQQLFIIMVGKQIVSNVQEFFVPKLKAWHQKRKLAKVRGGQICQEPKRWEEDYELIECEGLFEEYLEMVLQFGFITIFVAAFPLAPLFVVSCGQSTADRFRLPLESGMGGLPRALLPPSFSSQHVVFFCLRLIDWLVPDIPKSLEVKIKRERYLAKQALADHQEALLTTVSPDSSSSSPASSFLSSKYSGEALEKGRRKLTISREDQKTVRKCPGVVSGVEGRIPAASDARGILFLLSCKEDEALWAEPVSQTPGMNRLKAPEKQPQACPVGAAFSTTALLSSALLGAASLSPQRDYSFSFWQEIPEVKSRGLLEGLPAQQRHLQEVPEKCTCGRAGGEERAQAAAET